MAKEQRTAMTLIIRLHHFCYLCMAMLYSDMVFNFTAGESLFNEVTEDGEENVFVKCFKGFGDSNTKKYPVLGVDSPS